MTKLVEKHRLHRLSLKVMRTTLNLSGRPFSNHRLLYFAVGAVLLISLWLYWWTATQRELVAVKANVAATNVRDAQARLDKAHLDSEQKVAEQQQPTVSDFERLQLASARQLLERRAFSFNHILADIEPYVPKDSRLLSLKIEKIAPLGQAITANVEVKALGKTSAQMTEMMEKVEKSGGRFAIRQSTQEAVQDTGEVPFTLLLTYIPEGGEGQ